MSARGVFNRLNRQEEEYWVSVSDMMAGLMIVFLFIAIIIRPFTEPGGSVEGEEETETVQEIEKSAQEIEREREERIKQEIANILKEIDDEIYWALHDEFAGDLERWDAEIIRETLVFRLNHPEILFEKGQAVLQPEFKDILSEFCPRYISVLIPFEGKIDEVRIEGHTSTEWKGADDENEAYFFNMELSQNRTRSVLQFCMGVNYSRKRKRWVRRHMTANGLSSSHLILNNQEEEDKSRSRRVEFRVQTRKAYEILGDTPSLITRSF